VLTHASAMSSMLFINLVATLSFVSLSICWIDNLLVASVVDGVWDGLLNLLWESLLEGLWDLGVTDSVGNLASLLVGAGVVD